MLDVWATPLAWLLTLCAVLATATWILSLITREYSWVDRLWSIAPPLYVAFVAAFAGFQDERLNLMAVLAAGWGLRLTYNFARKGGYAAGGEDYRWAVMRSMMTPWQFQLFNATFIAPFQNALLLALAMPAWVAWQHRGEPLTLLDDVAVVLMLLFLLGETVADEQMWRFQTDKQRRRAQGQPLESRFMKAGLFRFCRHPNYACEMGLWWAFGLFAVASGGPWLDWHWAGAATLCLLFQGSTHLTEAISRAKYPEYATYQHSTPCFIPRLRRLSR